MMKELHGRTRQKSNYCVFFQHIISQSQKAASSTYLQKLLWIYQVGERIRGKIQTLSLDNCIHFSFASHSKRLVLECQLLTVSVTRSVQVCVFQSTSPSTPKGAQHSCYAPKKQKSRSTKKHGQATNPVDTRA